MTLQIVVPAAGLGKRFREAGYEDPKPLIQIHGRAMIEHVLHNIRPEQDHRITVVCQRAHYDRLKKINVDRLLPLDNVTEGAAMTVRYACQVLPLRDHLMVANSDQLLEAWSPTEFITSTLGANGSVVVFPGDGSKKWSYAEVNRGKVVRIVEKEPISEWATCGIYWWKSVEEYLRASMEMILYGDRVNGEFYVAPVFNYVENVRAYKVKSMIGLGTPEDLKEYLKRDM